MNLQKQLAKHQHRDRLVEVGIEAIEHALTHLPKDDPAQKIIRERLDRIRDHDVCELARTVRRDIKKFRMYEPEQQQGQRLIEATEELALVAVTDKYVSGEMFEEILVPAWNSLFMDERAMKGEMLWQEATLRPKIEKSFQQLRAAEKKLAA